MLHQTKERGSIKVILQLILLMTKRRILLDAVYHQSPEKIWRAYHRCIEISEDMKQSIAQLGQQAAFFLAAFLGAREPTSGAFGYSARCYLNITAFHIDISETVSLLGCEIITMQNKVNLSSVVRLVAQSLVKLDHPEELLQGYLDVLTKTPGELSRLCTWIMT
jgi:hypothetical protein